jgi:ribosome-associated protein YbcJ (S4-like RNA binding protein)
MVPIQIQTETIRLSQLLKLANVVQDGAEAKFRVEIRRGRKLRNGDRVEFAGETYEIMVVASSSSM